MILICPHSGIGNQIGNYVFGQFLKSLGINVEFIYSKDENIDRAFVLEKFNTEIKPVSKADLESFFKKKSKISNYSCLIWNIFSKKVQYFNSLYKILQRARLEYNIYPKKTPNLLSKIVSFEDVLRKKADFGAVCDCYSPISEFYDPKFREKMRNHFILKEEFDELNKKVFDKIKLAENSVGIHIRRGDYIDLKIPVVKIEFLFEKINFMTEKFDNPHFFVFSDDINWAKENLSDIKNVEFVDINDENRGYLDFALMGGCCHRIYSASSFSKWLQYLNPYQNSVEFMPKMQDLIIEE